MNRRTALLLPLLWGGLLPANLWAQQSQRRRSSNTREKTLEPSSSRDDPDASNVSEDEPNPPVNEAGFQWRRYDISKYTRLATNQATPPEKSIVDWIFKRTGVTEWHGEKLAVLSASRSQIRAYNSPDVLKQVDEVVERFINATEDVISLHIQFIAAVDTRWRVYGLSPAHTRRQRSPGPADLDHAPGGCRHRAVEHADPAGLPQAGRSENRNDQRAAPHDPDPRGAELRRRPSARELGGTGIYASRSTRSTSTSPSS